MKNFSGHVVIVGTVGDQNEGAGLHVHGLFSLSDAHEFATKVEEAFDAAKKEHGDKAFPYGEPYVEVAPYIIGVTPVEAVENWVYDPNLED